MTPSPKSDVDLVAATLAGSEQGFAELVERYQQRLFGLVRQYARVAADVEDIVQETFLKAYSKLDTYESRSSFSTWLFRIAVNTALDRMKRSGRSPVTTVEDPELGVGQSELAESGALPPPDTGLERAELAAITEGVLAEIPEVFRTTLILREFEELSYLEIAEMLEVSIGTVESRLYRARKRFREALLERHPELFAELAGPDPAAPRRRRRLGGGKARGGSAAAAEERTRDED